MRAYLLDQPISAVAPDGRAQRGIRSWSVPADENARASFIADVKREHGYVDAFRALHGYSRRDRSWVYPHRKTGHRLDHLTIRGPDVVA